MAGIFLPQDQDSVLGEIGVKDSKRLSDNRAREIAEIIKKGYTHSVVAIGPEKYNQLYSKLSNLNKILAWAHARVIENILEEVHCIRAITDQFGDAQFVTNALMKKGRTIELFQRPKAEEDMAVAAASVLARAEFLKRLFFLGREVGIELPKGSSPRSEEAGVRLIREQGESILDKVAKKHFKLTQRILNAAKG